MVNFYQPIFNLTNSSVISNLLLSSSSEFISVNFQFQNFHLVDFFFTVSISLLRFPIYSIITSIFLYALEHLRATLKSLSAKTNIWVILRRGSIVYPFYWGMVMFSCFFLCLLLLGYPVHWEALGSVTLLGSTRFNIPLTGLCSSSKLFLPCSGPRWQSSSTSLALVGLLRVCPIHPQFRGQLEIWREIIYRTWGSLFVALPFPGYAPSLSRCFASPDLCPLFYQASKAICWALAIFFGVHQGFPLVDKP